jgi:predicted nucleotidyltransferase
MLAPDVVEGVRNCLRVLERDGLAVFFGVVFGSRARGAARDEGSDIDLLVVSPVFDGAVSREEAGRLWRVAARADSRIEPVPCGERQWREDTESAVVEIARRDGVCLAEPGTRSWRVRQRW